MNKKIKFIYSLFLITVLGGGVTVFIIHTSNSFAETVDTSSYALNTKE
ncbi:MAG: hypothetical protein ACR2IQ_00805 [Minisyncoccia bacterium]